MSPSFRLDEEEAEYIVSAPPPHPGPQPAPGFVDFHQWDQCPWLRHYWETTHFTSLIVVYGTCGFLAFLISKVSGRSGWFAACVRVGRPQWLQLFTQAHMYMWIKPVQVTTAASLSSDCSRACVCACACVYVSLFAWSHTLILLLSATCCHPSLSPFASFLFVFCLPLYSFSCAVKDCNRENSQVKEIKGICSHLKNKVFFLLFNNKKKGIFITCRPFFRRINKEAELPN